MGPDSQLFSLPAVGLDQLARGAGLLTRVERKYVLDLPDLEPMVGRLAPRARVLEIDGRREFGYRTAYFDTPDLISYLSTAHRRPARFKVRTRTYTDQDLGYLEVKTRRRRGGTVKHRLPYEADPYTVEKSPEVLDLFAVAGVIQEPREFGLEVVVRYRRSTLLMSSSGSRITVDTDLSWQTPSGDTARLPGRAIVEVKSATGVPGDADRVLWWLGRRPVSVSKFATGLAALRPELPGHRWRRLLNRYFRTSSDDERALKILTAEGLADLRKCRGSGLTP